MKEITLKLADDIAEFITTEAQEMGITSNELIRYIVGGYVQGERAAARPHTSTGIIMGDPMGFLKHIFGDLNSLVTESLKGKAKAGELTCKNCTMKLTEQDITDGKCNTCGAPLKDALGQEGGL